MAAQPYAAFPSERAPAPTLATPQVLVSVLPVHALVAALMRDIGEPQLLAAAGQSPHIHSLKPSQVQRLQSADLIVWVGPQLEPSLGKIIRQRRTAPRLLTLMEHPEIARLPIRGNRVSRQAHATKHEIEAAPETVQEAGYDPHLWLSFANAKAIVRIVARELAHLDAANRDRYATNAEHLVARLEQFQQSLRARLRAVTDSPYVVFHDAYRYFEEEFGLRALAAVTTHPDRPPGAKRIRRIKHLIQTQNVRCVFSEPQFMPKLVDALVADSRAQTATLDPLGVALQPGPEAWFQLLQDLADSFVNCL